MGEKLHKLGTFAYKHKWWFLASWLVIFGIFSLTASHFYKPTSNAISIPGTKAQVALNRMNELFPDLGSGSGRIVFESKGDKQISDYTSQINDLVNKVSKVDGVNRIVSPFENAKAISSDGKIAYAQVLLKDGTGSIEKSTTTKIENAVNESKKSDLTIEVGGDIISHIPENLFGVGELSGLGFALIVLVVALGSIVVAGLPIMIALTTVGVSMAGLFSLSQVIDINQTTPVLSIMLGLAVGIDYSLFIVNKYKSLLLQGIKKEKAVAKAIGTAGNAVVFAASTVVIALVALSIVNIPFMTTMGLVGAATIALAALVAITLIPALLGIAGDKLFGPKTRKLIKVAQVDKSGKIENVNRSKIWLKWGKFLSKHPIICSVIPIAILIVIALPMQKLELGLPSDQYAAKDSTEYKSYDILRRGFGEGYNGPLAIVVEGLPVVSDTDKTAVRTAIMTEYQTKLNLASEAQKQYFAEKAILSTTPEQYTALQLEISEAQRTATEKQTVALAEIEVQIEKYSKLRQLSLVANELAKQENVSQALPVVSTDDGTKGMIQLISKYSPSDERTINLIKYIRDENNQSKITNSKNISLAVTGSTALKIDINEKLANALPEYLAIVVGLSLVILIVAFRSILVPIKATLGFLLSVLAMFGSMVMVYQWGWFGVAKATGPIVSFIPIVGIGILFGLAMDYEFFLVSSMHEAYSHKKDAKMAVVNGFSIASKVVTVAFIIMVSVFAGFISNENSSIQAISFGLAIGILVDALVVRMTIVPAVMTLLGKSAWWLPKWLDKILPRISIEGEEETKK